MRTRIGQAGLILVCLTIAGWLGWFGTTYWKAERHFGITRVLISKAPERAFVENLNAYYTMPWLLDVRRQLPGALIAIIATGKAHVDRSAAEVIWYVSQSVSPWDVGGMVSRASYLLNYQNGKGIGRIAEDLRKVAPWTSETWIVTAYSAIIHGNKSAARHALTKAEHCIHPDPLVLNLLHRVIGKMK